jgi:hypothetical protein
MWTWQISWCWGPLFELKILMYRFGGVVSGVGRATIAVSETLKEEPTPSLEVLVATEIAPDYLGSEIHPIRKVGDSGVWLVHVSHVISSRSLVPEERRQESQRILETLANRVWSDSLGDLKAWAAVVRPDYHPNPVIIFALKNVSYSDIFVPAAVQSGVMSVVVRSRDGLTTDYSLGRASKDSEIVFCHKLSPGEVVFMYPSYSFIDLAWRQNLQPGDYQVVVEYRNQRNGEARGAPGERVAVAAWKGELKAPSIELVLTMEEETVDPAEPGIAPVRVVPRK